MSAPRPFCFVLMPYGRKPDPAGGPDIDFDRVYEAAVRPAIEQAGLEPIRSDEDVDGGIIHRGLFERLLLCEHAVADLTTANANVFYELGVRHAARPRTTVSIHASGHRIPFDLQMVRSIPYELGPNHAFGDAEADALREQLAARLAEARTRAAQDSAVDSPLFQLLGGWEPAPLARDKTDVFRDRVALDGRLRETLAAARARGRDGLPEMDAVRDELGTLDLEEAAVVIDLLLSYRAVGAHDRMVDLVDAMPPVLARQVLVQEQLGFALNRLSGERDDPALRRRALEVLEAVVAAHGPSAETCGLIGRIHKDRWKNARSSAPREARVHLRAAIEAYTQGFQADWRDAFPGINALTLRHIEGSNASHEEMARLLPLVDYANRRRLEGATPDFWDLATRLELEILQRADAAADHALDEAMAAAREMWEPRSTADNLDLIREARAARHEPVETLDEIIRALREKGDALEAGRSADGG